MTRQARQVRTTLQGIRLAQFEALTETLGLTPSGVLKLAVRRLAALELNQNQSASSDSTEKAA
jgi:hypothetical protein